MNYEAHPNPDRERAALRLSRVRSALMAAATCDMLAGLALLSVLHPGVRALDPWLMRTDVLPLALAYLVAAMAEFFSSTSPNRHWLAIFMIFVARLLLPPLLLMEVLLRGETWTPAMSLLSLSSLWWVGLYLVLRTALAEHVDRGGALQLDPDLMEGYLEMAGNQEGESLADLSRHQPLMLIFLRQFGCPFCRDALDEISRRRVAVEDMGVRIVLVHMGADERAEEILGQYGLQSVDRVEDRHCELYRAFGLGRASLWQILAPSVIARGIHIGLTHGRSLGPNEGDGFRMPGVFMVQDCRILDSFRHSTIADRPDWLRLASCIRDARCAATPG
jgi:peroxiredoxin